MRNNSFFGRFKRRVQSITAENPGGRYFSMLLEQVFIEDAEILRKCFFPRSRAKEFGGCQAVLEYHFMKNRRADLALISADRGLIALIEVKEDDQQTSHSLEQTIDYINYAEKNDVYFVCISKHILPETSISIIRKFGLGVVYYGDLYRNIRKYSRDPKLATKLFLEYLEEERVAYYVLTAEDRQAAKLLIRQGNAMSRHIGTGRLRSAARMSAACDLLPTLVSNVEVLGNLFYQRHRSFFGNRFVPNFQFYPCYKYKMAKKYVREQKTEGYSISFAEADVESGSLYVWTEGRFKSTQHCYVWIGFVLYLEKSVDLAINYYVGVGANRRACENESHEITKYPTELQAVKKIESILTSLIHSNSATLPAYRQLLQFCDAAPAL